MLCTAQVIAQTTYPEIVESIRTLAGGGLIMVPSSTPISRTPRDQRDHPQDPASP